MVEIRIKNDFLIPLFTGVGRRVGDEKEKNNNKIE